VTNANDTKPLDFMDSSFLAGTLKYLYLLFGDHAVGPDFDLDRWVFNAEGHPLPALGSNGSSESDASATSDKSSVVSTTTVTTVVL
jgi:hypothetical protein